MRGRPVTPAGGLDIGKYDRQVKEEAASKKKEYKSMLDQVGFKYKTISNSVALWKVKIVCN